MTKSFTLGVLALGLTILTAPTASALGVTIWSQTRDYGSDAGKINPGGTDALGADYVTVSDQSSTRFSDVFDFSALSFESIERFDLTLTFAGAGPSVGCFLFFCGTKLGEDWNVRVQGSDSSISSDDYFKRLSDAASPQTVEISLSTDTGSIDAFSHSVASKTFAFWFSERSTGADAFKLDSAKLDIVGVVPLPGAVWMLGGMAGIGLWGARRKSRA